MLSFEAVMSLDRDAEFSLETAMGASKSHCGVPAPTLSRQASEGGNVLINILMNSEPKVQSRQSLDDGEVLIKMNLERKPGLHTRLSMVINGRVLPCNPKPRKALPCSAAETTTKSRGGCFKQTKPRNALPYSAAETAM